MTGPLGPFIVPGDVTITAVEHLGADVQSAAGAGPGDFVIMRPRGRAPSKIIDGATAVLLQSFREPRSIADAVIAFSRQRSLDPESTLVDAFPLLGELVRDRFLVPAEAPAAHPILASLRPGHQVGGYEVVSGLSAMEDTELYQVVHPDGRAGALKIAAGSDSMGAGAMLEHEAALLRRLDGVVAPRLLASGQLERRPFIVTEWCWGVPSGVAAEELRSARRGSDRPALLRLANAIVDAYATLHAHGIVHGDVHQQNVLVDSRGRVTILDFGLARLDRDFRGGYRVPRGGVGEYLEPEYACAILAQSSVPPATRLSDQYGLAALLFRLFTGSSYLEFSLLEDEAFRQIAEDEPRSFARCGAAPWPDVEVALRQALSKDPAARYQSLSQLSGRLARAQVPRVRLPPRRSTKLFQQLRMRCRSRIGMDGQSLSAGPETPPVASVNFGAAGLAWAAYRFACIEGEPEWLALAEIWLQRARELSSHPHAFSYAPAGLAPSLVGRTSLFHSQCGVHCVEAAVAAALGDVRRQGGAMREFVARSTPACDKVELSFGAAGTLLGCALLWEAAWAEDSEPVTLTRALGDRTMQDLGAWLEEQQAVASCTRLRNLGIAHGWAGVLYAILRWCDSTGCAPPAAVAARLSQVAECAEPSGRGVRWRWLDAEAEHAAGASMPGWCNGAAGMVHLWTAAHRQFGDERFARLAELAAWESWEHRSTVRNLCCGLAGRAYALLKLARYTGESVWVDRAWQLAERAARATPGTGDREFPDSLYKGEVGLALLAADLEKPAEAFMPFFEPEGWLRVREGPA